MAGRPVGLRPMRPQTIESIAGTDLMKLIETTNREKGQKVCLNKAEVRKFLFSDKYDIPKDERFEILATILARFSDYQGTPLFGQKALDYIGQYSPGLRLLSSELISQSDFNNIQRLKERLSQGYERTFFNFNPHKNTLRMHDTTTDTGRSFSLEIPSWVGIDVVADGYGLAIYDKEGISKASIEGGLSDHTDSGAFIVESWNAELSYVSYMIGSTSSKENSPQELINLFVEKCRQTEARAVGQNSFVLGDKEITGFGPTRDGFFVLGSTRDEIMQLQFNPKTKDVFLGESDWRIQHEGETRKILPESIDWDKGTFTIQFDRLDETGNHMPQYPYNYTIQLNDANESVWQAFTVTTEKG
jgi:hypothetical protein